MVSRPVDGIAYHGWQSIVEDGEEGGYRYTNSKTKGALKTLLHEVVKPLGPTFLKVKDPKPRIGFLDSFASEMFAGRGSYGWPYRSWRGDAYMALLHAGYQPRILFDETIRREGLDDLKALVLVHCDVLTEKVASVIKQFQDQGGIVVGDEHLAPAIQPDIRWKTIPRKGNLPGKVQPLQKKIGSSD